MNILGKAAIVAIMAFWFLAIYVAARKGLI
jgi:hypothetical protein